MSMHKTYDVNDALLDPAKVFDDPMEVVSDLDLSTEIKRKILLQWELDARELMVAEEENMAGGEPSMLPRVQEALRRLGSQGAELPHTDTKLG